MERFARFSRWWAWTATQPGVASATMESSTTDLTSERTTPGTIHRGFLRGPFRCTRSRMFKTLAGLLVLALGCGGGTAEGPSTNSGGSGDAAKTSGGPGDASFEVGPIAI